MSEQVTMTGRTASGARVGLGVFALGLAGAFLAGALVVSGLSTPRGAAITSPTVVEQDGSGVAVPVPSVVPAVRHAPGDEYRRIPDDGGGSASVPRIPAVGHAPGDEYKRIPDAGVAP